MTKDMEVRVDKPGELVEKDIQISKEEITIHR
jgi:hypothetical protein